MVKSKRKLKVWHIAVISIIVLGGISVFQLMTIDTSNIEDQNGCQVGSICFYQFDPARSSISVTEQDGTEQVFGVAKWVVTGDCITTNKELFIKITKELPTAQVSPEFPPDECKDRITFDKSKWTRNFRIINIVGIDIEQHQFFLKDLTQPELIPLPEMNIIGG